MRTGIIYRFVAIALYGLLILFSGYCAFVVAADVLKLYLVQDHLTYVNSFLWYYTAESNLAIGVLAAATVYFNRKSVRSVIFILALSALAFTLYNVFYLAFKPTFL